MDGSTERVDSGTDTAGKAAGIHLDDVSKSYGNVGAVEDVSLDIETGEFFTLLGPSGSGKSTLLKLLGGFVTPSGGAIFVDGNQIIDQPPQERDVSTVFQEYSLFPHMSVRENVEYGLEASGVAQDRQDHLVQQYLELLHISELADRYPSALSGGQRQRVALARSLVLEPKVLLLDEPLGPLDEKLRREMQFELRQLHQRLGTTFVYVTHDQEEALTMSDRIALLDHGQVVEVDSPQGIYESPVRRFTAEFIGSGNVIEGTVESVNDGTVSVETATGKTLVGQAPTDGIAPGQRVGVCIRSKHLFLDGDRDNALSGTVESVVYKGEEYDYLIDLDEGVEVTIESDHELPVGTGDVVTVGWDLADSMIVLQD